MKNNPLACLQGSVCMIAARYKSRKEVVGAVKPYLLLFPFSCHGISIRLRKKLVNDLVDQFDDAQTHTHPRWVSNMIYGDEPGSSSVTKRAAVEPMSGKAKQSPSLRRAFGAQVRQFRKSRGLSQSALAVACKLDPNYLGGIERGERNPTLENIVRIARSLEVPASLLVAGVDTQTTD
jgi:DNA-binding XRE family transcriptional regulator